MKVYKKILLPGKAPPKVLYFFQLFKSSPGFNIKMKKKL